MDPRSERERMLAGELYIASDAHLVEVRRRARRLTRMFNATTEDEGTRRYRLLRELFGAIGERVEVEPPFQCDYGTQIRVGSDFYANFGLIILDCNVVTIGDRVKFGPGVHIYAATHPVEPEIREELREYALPITIGNDVWVGGGTKILPGVTIGDGTTIGAGSVVSRSIPERVVAAGVPCRVIRSIP
jgi:maltose O-acetyltransferase